MQPPLQYFVLDGMACRLFVALYSLKQAHHAWFERFTSVVILAGFSLSGHDPTSLYPPFVPLSDAFSIC